jgi:hypothetical protein
VKVGENKVRKEKKRKNKNYRSVAPNKPREL